MQFGHLGISLLLLAVAIGVILAPAAIGARRGRGREGLAWGVLSIIAGLIFPPLALLGVIVMLLRRPTPGYADPHSPTARRECPSCRELMRRDASVCPHCRTESEGWSFSSGHWWVARGDSWYWLDESAHRWLRYGPEPAR